MSQHPHPSTRRSNDAGPLQIFLPTLQLLTATVPYRSDGVRFRVRYSRLLRTVYEHIKRMQANTQPFKLALCRARQLEELTRPARLALRERDRIINHIAEAQQIVGYLARSEQRSGLEPAWMPNLHRLVQEAVQRWEHPSPADLFARLPDLTEQIHSAQRPLRLFIRLWAREITGRMDRTGVNLLAQDYLVLPDRVGQTALHVAAENGDLDTIPEPCLTETNFLLLDHLGWTPTHLAAAHGHLHQVSRVLLTERNLLVRNGEGWNGLHLAFAGGHARQLPADLLTARNLALGVGHGANCLHLAAYTGTFASMPRHLQTLDNALLRDDRLQTCLHYAATGGFLDQFPDRLKTPETLALEDASGRTPEDYRNARQDSKRQR